MHRDRSSVSLILGLKVKLSLPDEGLIVENVGDPNQSWMYKRKELLYFWRHPLQIKVIVIISKNRPSHDPTRPYSASIFALRGHDSISLFIERAQAFFARLTPPIPLERSATIDSRSSKPKKKPKEVKPVAPPAQSPSVRKASHSAQRTEFEPVSSAPQSRTFSETTVSSETPSKRSHSHYDDERMTNMSTPLSTDCVAELVKELKELRQEIAMLKLEHRATPVRSISTSPLSFQRSITNEADAETQTDFTLFSHRRRLLTRKARSTAVETSETVGTNRTKLSDSYMHEEKPHISPCSPTNGSDGEGRATSPSSEPTLDRSCLDAALEVPSQFRAIQEESTSLPPLSSSSSTTAQAGKAANTVSFHSEIQDTIDPSEHVYENIPILIHMNATQGPYGNLPIFHEKEKVTANGYLYVTFAKDPEAKAQQEQYLSQLLRPQNGLSLAPPLEDTSNDHPPSIPIIEPPPITATPTPPIPTQVHFADHLTNPSFYADKQLLANTIANQFGVDLKSPYLPQLISNQHLFVAQKRTFANMIWQLAPDELEAFCSSPNPLTGQSIRTSPSSLKNPTTKSILKANRPVRSISKRQRISWNTKSE